MPKKIPVGQKASDNSYSGVYNESLSLVFVFQVLEAFLGSSENLTSYPNFTTSLG